MRQTSFTLLLPVLLVAACSGAAGTDAPKVGLSLEAKTKKVAAMTKALSLADNDALKKTTESMQAMSTAMSSGGFKQASSAMSGIVAAGGGTVAAPTSSGMIGDDAAGLVKNGGASFDAVPMAEVAANSLEGARALVQAYGMDGLAAELQSRMRQNAYSLQATAKAEDGVSDIEYDDETGEVTSVSGKDAKATFTFDGGGLVRKWKATIAESPDKTTGTLELEIGAKSWRAKADPIAMSPRFGVPAAQAPKVPYKFFNNEEPVDLTSLKLKIAAKPKGDAKLAASIEITADDVKALAIAGGKAMVSHLALKGTFPSLTMDSDLRLSDDKYALKGGIQVDTDEGNEALKYDVGVAAKTFAVTANLTNVGAGVKISSTFKPAPFVPGKLAAAPVVKTVMTDTDSNTKLADVSRDPKDPTTLLIKYTNGTTTKWALAPKNILGGSQPAATAPDDE